MGHFEAKLRKRPVLPRSEDELFRIISEEWYSLPYSYFTKLSDSMDSRVKKVREVKERSTKY